MQTVGLIRHAGLGAVAVAACLVSQSGSILAGEQGAGALQGQVILNPDPGFAYAAPQMRVHSGLADLAPASGGSLEADGIAVPAGCPGSDAWSVVVLRGNQAPETVHGHAVTIIPADC